MRSMRWDAVSTDRLLPGKTATFRRLAWCPGAGKRSVLRLQVPGAGTTRSWPGPRKVVVGKVSSVVDHVAAAGHRRALGARGGDVLGSGVDAALSALRAPRSAGQALGANDQLVRRH